MLFESDVPGRIIHDIMIGGNLYEKDFTIIMCNYNHVVRIHVRVCAYS